MQQLQATYIETPSTARMAPAVAAIAVHLVVAYLIAVSAGVVSTSKPPPNITLVPIKPEKLPIVEETLPPPDQRSTIVTARISVPVPKDDFVIEETRDAAPKGERSITEVDPPIERPSSVIRIVSFTDPNYPNISRLRAEEGVVYVRVTIAASGALTDVRVERSSGYARLDAAALEAVRSWRFAPAMHGSRAVAGSAVVPVRFKLRE